MLTILMEYSDNLIICLSTDFSVLQLSKSAKDFYNWQQVEGKNFLELCRLSHCISPIKNDYFLNSCFEQVSITSNSSSQEHSVNWKIHPLKTSNDETTGVILIGKIIDLQQNDFASRLNDIINCIPGCLYWKDCDGYYQGCNKLTAFLAGLDSVKEIIGKTDKDLWGKQADWLTSNDKQVISSGKPVVVQEKLKTADGRWLYFTGVKMPIKDEKGNIIGIIGNSLDITELKNTQRELKEAKEEAEAASRAKSIFIANMSHDVRTPLAGVIGASDQLRHEGETSKDRELSHVIHISAERLLQLLDDILEIIAADEYHESNLNLETFSLKDRLVFLGDLMESNTRQNDITFNSEISEGVPEYIISDRVKIDRILLNLISNAFKFTQSGSISIYVNMLRKSEQEAILEFNICDTGIGIPNAQLDKIFDRFYRIDPSYSNKYKGHGIGLFIVHKYVELLKGNITVESEVGKGSTFRITLPVKIGNASDVQPQKEKSDVSDIVKRIDQTQLLNEVHPAISAQTKLKDGNESIKVLVIEDDSVARRVVKSMLMRAGFEVEDVNDAEHGFWQVMNNSYDLILTDIGLPGMDGNAFTMLVRSWEKITQHQAIPIIGLTAHGKAQQSIAEKSGMNLLFSKPLTDKKLTAIKEQFFTSKSSEKSSTIFVEPTTSGLGYDLPDTEEELFKLDNYPLLDEEDGIEASGGDSGFLKELLTMLINETLPLELPLLIEAHSEDNWERIQSIAHKLKGGALYCGTKRLRFACQYTERYRLAGHSKLLEPLYSQLLAVIKETIEYIKKWLAR